MATARFYIIGDSNAWLRVRVTEEINARGLEGSVVEADDGRLTVIVEGKTKSISELHANLCDAVPDETTLTKIELSKASQSRSTDMAGSDSVETIITLLREIEKNTRRINQKIDAALMQKPASDDDEDYGRSNDDEDYEHNTSSEDAESSFASMFGD